MSTLSNAIHGVIRGKTIELAEECGLPDGQPVTVTLRPIESTAEELPPGEGLRRAFGTWAEDAEQLDKFLAHIRRARRRIRPEIEP